jgi:hypothetical protein
MKYFRKYTGRGVKMTVPSTTTFGSTGLPSVPVRHPSAPWLQNLRASDWLK